MMTRAQTTASLKSRESDSLNASARNLALRSQVSRLVLRSTVSAAVIAGASVLAPATAWANCVVGATTVDCGTTVTIDSTFPTNAPNDRNYVGTLGVPVVVIVDPGATVSGNGIAVSNTGSGGITITNNGTISVDAGNTPTAGGTAALSVAAAGGPIIYTGGSIINNGTGDAFDVTQTAGSGSININVSGLVGSASGSGIVARDVSTSTGISITTDAVTATTAGKNAIDAQSQSLTGNVTEVANGNLQAGNAGMVAAIFPGAATGNVDVTANGSITARFGIDAENFGSGSTTVKTVGPINVTSGNGIFALTTGGNVSVDTGAVTSTGNTAIIARQTSAAGTGTLSVTTSGAVSGTTGIEATNAGTGASTIIANSTVTGTAAEGIKTTSAGAVTVTANAAVTGATLGLSLVGGTSGSGNILVNGTGGFNGGTGDAANILNSGSGTVTVNLSGASSSTGGEGIVVRDTAAGGNISVTTGAVTALAAGKDAIDVQSQSLTGNVTEVANGNLQAGNAGMVAAIFPGAATGNIDVTANGSITARFGIDAENFGTGMTTVKTVGPVNVTSGNGIYARTNGGNVSVDAGAVTSTGNTAIIAQQTSAAGAGTVTVTATNVSGTAGIVANNAGSGNATVNANGDVTGTAGAGIAVALTNAANQGNAINVGVAAGTTTTGTGASGVATDLGQSNGTSTVALSGRATGSNGVQQISVAGNNLTTLVATGSADGIGGVVQTNVTGTNTITNAGTIAGSTAGVVQNSTGAGNGVLNNSGSVTGPSAVSATLAGGTYTLNNLAAGTLNGSINVSGSALATSSIGNAGTWNASGASGFDGSWANSGTTNVANAASITVAGPSVNNATGVIRFAGNGTLVTNLSNAGLIDARNGTAGQIITLTGNYVGGGVVGLDAAIAANTADRFAISGTATGTSTVLINILNQGILPTGFLPLVTVGTGTPAINAFSSAPLPTTGLFTESFGLNPANASQFGINQTFNPNSTQLSQLSTVAGSVSVMIDEPVSALITDRSDRTTQVGVWGRGSAGDFNQDLTTSFAASAFSTSVTQRVKSSYYVLQSGLDVGLLGIGGGSLNAHLGVTGGRYSASVKVPGGVSHIDTDFLGGYVAVTGAGFAIDGTYRKEWRDFSLFNASLIANGAVATKGTAWAGAVNASYKLALGGFYLKPMAGYSFGTSKIDPFAIDGFTLVTPRDDKISVWRYGATLGWEGQVSPSIILAPYLGVFGIHNSSNTEQTDLVFASSAIPTITTGFTNTMEFVGGLDMHDPTNKIGAFVRGGVYTSNGVRGASFSVGARLNF